MCHIVAIGVLEDVPNKSGIGFIPSMESTRLDFLPLASSIRIITINIT